MIYLFLPLAGVAVGSVIVPIIVGVAGIIDKGAALLWVGVVRRWDVLICGLYLRC